MGSTSGGVKGCGSHCRHCHAADPGFTLRAVDSTAMLTQVAVGKWFQVIFMVHIAPGHERLFFLFYRALIIAFTAN